MPVIVWPDATSIDGRAGLCVAVHAQPLGVLVEARNRCRRFGRRRRQQLDAGLADWPRRAGDHGEEYAV